MASTDIQWTSRSQGCESWTINGIRLPHVIFWVDSAFELGQKYGQTLATVFPDWLEKIPVMGNVGNYFANGSFDQWDLAAIGLGSLIASSLGELTSKRKEGVRYEKARTS